MLKEKDYDILVEINKIKQNAWSKARSLLDRIDRGEV